MDLEKTEARNDCAGEGQQQPNQPTKPAGNDVSTRAEELSQVSSPRLPAASNELSLIKLT
jgi:hypothetical protein